MTGYKDVTDGNAVPHAIGLAVGKITQRGPWHDPDVVTQRLTMLGPAVRATVVYGQARQAGMSISAATDKVVDDLVRYYAQRWYS
ncbi:hypothetical protein [Streptomyces sp. MP131-18]|uniref:hypothetical protein n=1 Tax=Streptomyces sp. MP131-18 TaxID=1857892 RepID=UPI00097CAD1B|nr:hypothetical protein [Streptomyces sp. MP131-18]ONK13283.1 hypothetical protein STBA_40460 [Streptomyces sp. MP131-18]